MANGAPRDASVLPRALAEARTLEADGRPLDAIALLTAADRAERDASIEQYLVELRHDAFAALDHTPPEALPPLIEAAPGPPGPLPELSGDELTATALRTGLARHGCLLVRGLIPTAEAERLAEGVDTALAAFDAGAAGEPVSATTPWYAPFTPRSGDYRVGGRRNWVRASGAVWTADSPRMLADLVELIDRSGVGALVTDHLGERPVLSANKCTLRRVPISSNTDWHQDGAFLGGGVRTVNLWLALSHCGRDAPGLDIVPRRIDHVAETGTEGAFFDWSVAPDVVERLAEGAPVIRPEFAPGDALLFDHLFLHRTAIGPEMTRERHAIETWFFTASAYPDGQIPLVY